MAKNHLKPRIGQPIYFLTDISCTLTTVGYIGKDSFIIDSPHPVMECYTEWYYDSYNIEWFTDFNKAIKALKERTEFNPEVDKIIGELEGPFDGYWEVVCKD